MQSVPETGKKQEEEDRGCARSYIFGEICCLLTVRFQGAGIFVSDRADHAKHGLNGLGIMRIFGGKGNFGGFCTENKIITIENLL